MTSILDTNGTNTWISHVSEYAKHRLVIVCPFLDVNPKLRRTIELADGRGVGTFVVYGKRELDPDTLSWLKGLRNSSIACIPDLHAKVYMNEDTAVISSMNLYQFSQVHNEELGVLFDRRRDRAEFREVASQVMRLIDMSEKEHGRWDVGDMGRPSRGLLRRERPAAAEGCPEAMEESEPEPEPEPEPEETILCHCIRCGRVIPSTHECVYCGRCMDSWQRYSKTGYVEADGHCYICGKDHRVSADRPACVGCYKRNQGLVDARRGNMRAFPGCKV